MCRVLVLWVYFWSVAVIGQTEIVQFDNSQQQKLYQKVIKELRCLVCQNQNLADSNADLAQDLRNKSQEMIKSGKSYTEIIDYMTERYGDFVLYRPRVRPATLMLWFSPFVFLTGIIFIAVRRIRSPAPPADDRFTNEEMEKAKNLLRDKPET